MSFGKKVVAILAVVAVIAVSLLGASGVLTANAAPGPIRVHIDTGVVVVGHEGGCFVQEGNVEAEGTQGRFVANLKVFGNDPDAPGKPCGVIRGVVNLESHPHFAGLFGFWAGSVTSHSGPQPIGDFTGAFVSGSWQLRHVSGTTGVAKGEGSINVSLF